MLLKPSRVSMPLTTVEGAPVQPSYSNNCALSVACLVQHLLGCKPIAVDSSGGLLTEPLQLAGITLNISPNLLPVETSLYRRSTRYLYHS